MRNVIPKSYTHTEKPLEKGLVYVYQSDVPGEGVEKERNGQNRL